MISFEGCVLDELTLAMVCGKIAREAGMIEVASVRWTPYASAPTLPHNDGIYVSISDSDGVSLTRAVPASELREHLDDL